VAKREIATLRKLQGHPNIIRLLNVFQHNQYIYLVFEKMQQTLLEALEESNGRGLHREQVRQLVFQIVRALDHMHSLNVTTSLTEDRPP